MKAVPAAGRLHPFTPFVLTAGTALLAFLLPAPVGPLALYALVAAAAFASRHWRAVAGAAAVCLPLWGLLFLLHGLMQGGDGYDAALAQGARLGAVATASLMLFRSFDPSRFLDACAARGWSFHAAYLIVATLQAAPRLKQRAAAIVEAQRARGLQVRGGPLRRVGALVPLALPLLLGSLAEVDDRTMALETRCLGGGGASPGGHSRRTPLVETPVRQLDRVLWWGTVAAVLGALAVMVSTVFL